MPVRLALPFVLLAASPAWAATVCYAPLDSLEGWTVRSLGEATAQVVEDRVVGRCVEVATSGGTVLLSRSLPVEAVAGSQLSVRCLVQTTGVVRGTQLVSLAKLHLAVETPAGVRHSSTRFTGTRQWQREGFTADVPADAQRIVLNLGLEACSGRMRLAGLMVRNDRLGVYPLSLAAAANAEHSVLGVKAFPESTVWWNEIPLEILRSDKNAGGDCLRLRGAGHEDWPHATGAAIETPPGATAIYILHGVLGGEGKASTPCAIWKARYAGGYEASLSVFEGREIGRIGNGADHENWRVAWTGRDEAGEPVTFGVTKWVLYGDSPLRSLSCEAYHGAPPVILALTAVEEPPRGPEPGEDLGDDETE
jgi:hypothetical protein